MNYKLTQLETVHSYLTIQNPIQSIINSQKATKNNPPAKRTHKKPQKITRQQKYLIHSLQKNTTSKNNSIQSPKGALGSPQGRSQSPLRPPSSQKRYKRSPLLSLSSLSDSAHLKKKKNPL